MDEWMDDARCAEIDPEWWFPADGSHGALAVEVCMGCDVREQCLAYALRLNITEGIYGGLPPRKRRVLSRAA